MNGVYFKADLPIERLAIAVKACLELYYRNHQDQQYHGMRPNYGYYEDYLKAFLDRELLNAKLEQLFDPRPRDVVQRELAKLIETAEADIERILNIGG